MNTLVQRMDGFAQTHHDPALKALSKELEKMNPFASNKSNGRLMLNADALVNAVLTKEWKADQLVTEDAMIPARASTLHMPPPAAQSVRGLISHIQQQLAEHYQRFASKRNLSAQALSDRVVGNLQTHSPFDRLYPDAPKELERSFKANRKRLTFTKIDPDTTVSGHKQKTLMRFHKFTLTVETPEDAQKQLATAIRAKILMDLPLTPTELEILDDHIQEQTVSPSSELARLVRLISTETIGQLKRAAELEYLSFVEQQAERGNKAKDQLRVLQRRLQLLQAYLADEQKGDADYLVSYQGTAMDVRVLFAPSHIFHDLPVFPIVDGMIGKTRDGIGKESYTFGMKLKLNGKVTRYGNLPSFDYHLALLKKGYKTHPERLVRLAVLYFVVFSEYGNIHYDPIAALENDIMPILQGDSSTPEGLAAIEALFTRIADTCAKAKWQVKEMAASLRAIMKYTTLAPRYDRDVRVGIRGGIVENSSAALLDEERLFQQQTMASDRKAYLSFMEVTFPQATSQAIFTLNAKIVFDDVQCFDMEFEKEECTIAYDTKDLALLPILFSAPSQPIKPLHLVDAPLSTSVSGLSIPCSAQIFRKGKLHSLDTGAPSEWFLYRYIVSLLSYLAIDLIASTSSKKLFISLVRWHEKKKEEVAKEDVESFIADMSKFLSQILGADYLTNSQGLHPFRDGKDDPKDEKGYQMRQRTAATSLYAPLPKTFSFTHPFPIDILPRLGILVASSRESDSVRPTSNIPQERLITVYGAVTEIEHLDTQTARIQRLNTFDETYSSQHIYKTPDVIFDQIHHLYQRGHRHIFYVAQAPYSSTIRVARASQNADLDDENGGLFFLSRDIVKRCVQGKPDLHIYPVFRDQYHAMKLSALDAATLYTQDVEELMRVVGDKSQQMVVFLNLFSGLPNVADRDGVDKYHGVVSYATLLNVFEDILGSRSIYAALIQDDNGQNALKSMLVHYLMLFHLSQYQARRNEIAIKLDPYDMIIGEKSVGVAASQSHASRSLRFNFLAFLSFVRKIIKAGDGK